jgi:DNA-binding NarL/FixJ family response regulator
MVPLHSLSPQRLPQRILLCLSDALFLTSLHDYIEYRCDAVVVAKTINSAEALWLAEQSQPDVAVIEIGSQCDGLKVASALKEHLPLVKIVMLCATEDKRVEREAKELGVDAFILTLSGLASVTQAITSLAEREMP